MATSNRLTTATHRYQDASDLMELTGQLRRSVRRLVRRHWPHEPLTPSAVELVRLLDANPGLRVREAATALGLVPNTVSTLVGVLSARGLIARTLDERDARAARLFLTPAAKGRVADWRDRRAQIVGEALDRLDPGERRAIHAALPAIRRLLSEVGGA
jgi:DNA-binding MarR family transcriptional regulator